MASFKILKGASGLHVPSPASALNDLNSAALNNAAAANGGFATVEDYQKAIDRLSGSSLPANLSAVAVLRKQQAALQSKLYDDWFAKGNLDSAFKNSTAILGKKYALEPEALIKNLYALYDYHGAQIEQHLKKLQDQGSSDTALASYGSKIADQAASLEQLMDHMNSVPQGQDPQSSPQVREDAGQMAFAVQTDGQGKITSLTLEPFDKANPNTMPLSDAQGNKLGNAIRTTATYGGVPMFIVPKTDPANPGTGYIAQVGDLKFVGNTADAKTGQAPLQLEDKRGFFTKLLDKGGDAVIRTAQVLGGKHPSQTTADLGNQDRAEAAGAETTYNNAVDLKGHIKPTDFNDMTSVPIGTTWVDATGKYYFMSDDGSLVSAPSAKVLGQSLNKNPSDIQKDAQFINSKDLQTVQSQQNPYLRSQNWLTTPVSPLQTSGSTPTSFSSQPSTTAMSIPGQTPQNPPSGAIPNTTSKAPAIKSSQGPALAQNNTQQITAGAQGLPNAMQTKG